MSVHNQDFISLDHIPFILVFPRIACKRIRNEINIRKYRFLTRNFEFFRVIRDHNSKFSNRFRTYFEIFRNIFRSWKHYSKGIV